MSNGSNCSIKSEKISPCKNLHIISVHQSQLGENMIGGGLSQSQNSLITPSKKPPTPLRQSPRISLSQQKQAGLKSISLGSVLADTTPFLKLSPMKISPTCFQSPKSGVSRNILEKKIEVQM